MVMVCIRHLRGIIFWLWYQIKVGELVAARKIHLFGSLYASADIQKVGERGSCLREVNGGQRSGMMNALPLVFI